MEGQPPSPLTVNIPCETQSISESLNVSDIVQLDGNDSIISASENGTHHRSLCNKPDKITSALNMPVVATYNALPLSETWKFENRPAGKEYPSSIFM